MGVHEGDPSKSDAGKEVMVLGEINFRRDSTGVQEGREEICKILYPRFTRKYTKY